MNIGFLRLRIRVVPTKGPCFYGLESMRSPLLQRCPNRVKLDLPTIIPEFSVESVGSSVCYAFEPLCSIATRGVGGPPAFDLLTTSLPAVRYRIWRGSTTLRTRRTRSEWEPWQRMKAGWLRFSPEVRRCPPTSPYAPPCPPHIYASHDALVLWFQTWSDFVVHLTLTLTITITITLILPHHYHYHYVTLPLP